MSDRPAGRVFISSTAEDLQEHRAAARDAAIGADLFPIMMEYFVASGEKPPLAACLNKVSEADVLVVIVAHRYGWVPPDQDNGQRKSITWLECERAVADGKEVLAFLVDENHAWSDHMTEAYRLTAAMQNGTANEELFRQVNRNVASLKEFKAWLNGRGIRATFTSKEDLRRCVSDALHDWRRRHRPTSLPNKVADAEVKPLIPTEYIEWLRNRCCNVELMGLDIKDGLRVRLNHVYTPLATSMRPEALALEATEKSGERPKERDSAQLLLELLDRQSLYVFGAPGSGKSTFCNWCTFLACSGEMPELDVPAPDAYRENFPQVLRDRLPILIRLRDFWSFLPSGSVLALSMSSLLTSLKNWWDAQECPGLDWDGLKSHLEHGSALLMLDGVDEVPPVQTTNGVEWFPRPMLLSCLAAAVGDWNKKGNRVVVTSRPYGLSSEEQRKLGLAHAPILELDRELQALLVRRWFARLKENRELGLQTAEAMIDHIRVEQGLDDLAANPLLLTAMCIIYDQGKRLPHDKHTLYDKIVDTVLHKRYAVRQRIDPIRGRLAAVALGMHTGEASGQHREAPEASVTNQEIDLILQAYHKVDGTTDKGLRDIVDVREDLLSQSGLLVSGENGASFFHLSIQEFLAARQLFVRSRGRQEEAVELFLTRGRFAGWRNTLAFHFGYLLAVFGSHAGVEFLRAFANRIELLPLDVLRRLQPYPAWHQVIALGDALQILVGQEVAIPEDLLDFFQKCVFQAIEQEIPVHERQKLATALGRLGDPRIELDLRMPSGPDRHPGYVKIPASKYLIGEEKQSITIDQPFWLSKYPVTNSQYKQFIDAGGYMNRDFWSEEGWKWREAEGVLSPGGWRKSAFNSPNQPAAGVSWWEAEAFCHWAGGFLPTEQQWEAAARGTHGFEYPWGNSWEDSICNSTESGIGGTSAVGIFPRDRSPLGLRDMGGNVVEWCADMASTKSATIHRLVRGGGWIYEFDLCRAASRDWYGMGSQYVFLGFRVAAGPLSTPSQEPGE